MARETSFHDFDYDIRKIYDLCHNILENEDDWIFIIAEDENSSFCGFFVGFIEETYFGTDKIASDYLLYVIPEKRKGRAAYMLLKEFDRWAQKRARYMQLGVTTGLNEENTIQFYKKMGYHRKGVIMQKEIKRGMTDERTR